MNVFMRLKLRLKRASSGTEIVVEFGLEIGTATGASRAEMGGFEMTEMVLGSFGHKVSDFSY